MAINIELINSKNHRIKIVIEMIQNNELTSLIKEIYLINI